MSKTKRPLTIEQFIERFEKRYPDHVYDFSDSVYEKTYIKMKYVCKLHGDCFTQPLSILKGSGCVECGKKRHSDFIETLKKPPKPKKKRGRPKLDKSNGKYKTYNETKKMYEREKRRSDPQFRMKKILRTRIWNAVTSQYTKKAKKTSKLLGCSWECLKEHLEKQFVEGMTWENMGDWHIDHIIPCASFDLTNLEKQEICFHYTNLQPLWAEDNLSKGDRIRFEDLFE
jgi:hypothetical protein